MSIYTKLKRVAVMRAGGTPPVEDPSMWDEGGLPWVSIGDMTATTKVCHTDRHVSTFGIAAKSLPIGKPGTILFAMYASVGALSALGVEGSWNQAILGIEPIPGAADARFVKYWLEHLRSDIHALTRSNTQDNLNAEQVGNLPFPLLDRATQRTIADFLDRETARIDALISTKRRMVELLDQRFWSLVSGKIESRSPTWLPLRRWIDRITDGPFGSSLTSSDYVEDGARVVRLGNIGRGFFRDDDKAFISPEYFQSLLRHRVCSGDLLIAGLGDTNNHVGRACVAPDLGSAIVKADCYCASVDRSRGNAAFLALYLSSPLGERNVAIAARGTTRSRINLDIAREIQIPLLPLSAQREIVSVATSERRRTQSLRSALRSQIALLQERRQALIAVAVTGQLDVPEAA